MGRKKKEKKDDGPPKKKSKKSKHKEYGDVDLPDGDSVESSSIKPLTLKIKFGNEVISKSTPADEISVDTSSLKSGSEEFVSIIDSDIEEEEEEEAWLDALESGTVDERGYIPQYKDPSAMTARQRALQGAEDVQLYELPLMKKKGEEETEEMLLKKSERNRKRRLQAIKRREKHKADTVQKLLQKQSTKRKDDKKQVNIVGHHIQYINNFSGITLSLTPSLDFPLPPSTSPAIKHPAMCCICGNIKKYNDSQTKRPLCSLECYKLLHETL